MKKYDLITVGGGLTGVAAAVSAARQGMKVLIIEKSGSLGGAMANCLVFPFMSYWTVDRETKTRKYLSAGIFTEMCRRHQEYTGIETITSFNSEYFKIVLDDMCTEAGVDVLFHAYVCDTEQKDRRIRSVTIAMRGGNQKACADYFVDASGDGDLFALAGCDFQLGRDEDGLCQPMTTCFRMSGVDIPALRKDSVRVQKLYKEKQASGEISDPRENLLLFFEMGGGILHLNTTRIIRHDPTDPFSVSRAEMMARRQIHEIFHFLKENSESCANSMLISIASEIGVRESRKLRGVYILTEADIKACTQFEDRIALGNYPIDIHNPSGSGTTCYYFKDGEYYSIPYRSLLPREYDNLLVAGRCLSASHEAQSAVRIMPICCTMGQAAGTAAAIAFRNGGSVSEIPVGELQEKLIRDGAVLDV